GTVLAAIVAATLLRQIRQTEQQRKKADYHALKHRVKSSALRTLREERHEFRNQLALISTYLQMGEKEKAQHCIDYAAASLSQEGGGPYLPEDAWLMVLEGKKQTALMCGIEFTVEIKAEPPYAFAEQRLLPKLISNLVDNAFAATLKAPGPRVRLLWEERETGRTLRVSNNGPPITAEQGRKIFQAGVTTKDNKQGMHGWGLVICSRIATELNGTLSYTSTPTETSFTLRLPPADVNGEERACPLP
ncbi:MAG TPA: sensor histidine kinase, partial [Firmicutes bacterium]|nr:sensor histidine kinase [Bacillota bacterium]